MAIPKIQAGNDINADTFLKTPNGQEDYGVKTNSKGKLHPVFSDSGIEFTPTENVEKGQLVYVTESGLTAKDKPYTVNMGDFYTSATWGYGGKPQVFKRSDGDLTVFINSPYNNKLVSAILKKQADGTYLIDNTTRKTLSYTSGSNMDTSKLIFKKISDNVYIYLAENKGYSSNVVIVSLFFDGNVLHTVTSKRGLSFYFLNDNDFLLRYNSSSYQAGTMLKVSIDSATGVMTTTALVNDTGVWTNSTKKYSSRGSSVNSQILKTENGVYMMEVFTGSQIYWMSFLFDESTNTITWGVASYLRNSDRYAVHCVEGNIITTISSYDGTNQDVYKKTTTVNADGAYTSSSDTSYDYSSGYGGVGSVLEDFSVDKETILLTEVTRVGDKYIIVDIGENKQVEVSLGGGLYTASFSTISSNSNCWVETKQSIYTGTKFEEKSDGSFVGFIYEDKEAGETATVTTANILDLFESLEIGEYYKVNENGVLETTTENYTGEKFLAINNTTLIKK